MHVHYSREELSLRFAELDAELGRLSARGAPEELFWAAFEQLVHLPTASIDESDRRWWWEQVYATMERHGLTELGQPTSTQRSLRASG